MFNSNVENIQGMLVAYITYIMNSAVIKSLASDQEHNFYHVKLFLAHLNQLSGEHVLEDNQRMKWMTQLY